MKKRATTFLFTLLGLFAAAQEPCATGRYSTDVFSNVDVTSNIVYGSNLNFNGTTKTLKLDFYEPQGDTETARPLIVWVHSGSFLGGSKTDGDVVTLANSFAKKGFACASIDYRTGFFPIDSVNSIKAVLRAVHDLRAAVRFFYKDVADGVNAYKIDTNNIFVGGTSAGAITALHFAYLDKTCEVSETNYISQATLDQVGGMEGISGNPCYGTAVKGVINLCGALAQYWWLEAGDVPLCSMHGTQDGTVGYSRQVVNPGVPLMYLDGSRMIYERANAVGVPNKFYTWYGADHDPFAGSAAYMDTTINFVRDFLIEQLGCTDAALQAENTPFGTADLYAFTPCSTHIPFTDCTSLGMNENNISELVLSPNPATNEFKIDAGTGLPFSLRMTDMNGRTVYERNLVDSAITVDCSSMKRGVYLVILESELDAEVVKVILQ